jgi:hypothetical protein
MQVLLLVLPHRLCQAIYPVELDVLPVVLQAEQLEAV